MLVLGKYLILKKVDIYKITIDMHIMVVVYHRMHHLELLMYLPVIQLNIKNYDMLFISIYQINLHI
jgi:hypothetical protein